MFQVELKKEQLISVAANLSGSYRTALKLLLVVIAITTAPLALSKQQAPTLKQIVETRLVSTSQISTDGNSIAYTLLVPREAYKDDDGKPYSELHVTDKQGNSRPFVTGKVNVSDVQWSTDSRFIYYLAKRNDDKFSGVYRIAIDGGESQKMVTAKANIQSFSLNANSSKLAYLAEANEDDSIKKLQDKGFKAKVYEESAKKNNVYIVALDNPEKAAVKLDVDQQIISVAYHPVEEKLLLRVSPSPLVDDQYTASQYRIYNLKTMKVKSFKTEGKLEQAVWSKNGKYVAIIGSQDKHDPAAGRLFVGDSQSAEITEPVKNYPGHVKDLVWLSDYQLAFLGHKGTQSEVSVINLDSQTITNKIAQGDIVLRVISGDSSGNSLIGIGSSDKHPREVFDLSSGTPKRLTDSNPWLKITDIPEQQTINYLARDGVEIQGVLVYPTNYKKNKRYPLIMMVHGGPEAHVSDDWLDKYSYPIKYAAANDFAVFLPNYRGSTGRGVEFSKMGQADYAGAEFNDLVDAINHLSKIGLIDKKRVGITGGSYGGYASAWGATALSEHFAASVMFVGISDQLSKFGTTDIPQEMHNVHARNYPWDKWQWMLERSPIYHTDKAKTPILIMHGDSDTRVHPSQSMELYRYIKTRTDTPVRLVFYPGEGHGNRKTAAQLDYSMRLMRWMEFYLKGKNKGKQIPPYELDHQQRMDALDKT